MFDGSNCDRKSHLSGILTEPLNPRVLSVYLIINTNIQISTLNHSLEIRSLYIQVYNVRYVNMS